MATSTTIHSSIWIEQTPLPLRFEMLHSNHRSDVAVIGGGISGLSTALELLERGYSVAIYEAFQIGSGTTTGSTGHLDAYPELGASALVRSLGIEKARQYISLLYQSIDSIEQRSGDGCDVRRVPAYFYSENLADENSLRREFEAAKLIGLKVEWVSTVPFPQAKLGFRIDGLGRIDMSRYARRLADLVIAAGGTIFENSPVAPILEKHPRHLAAGNGTAEFSQVVCCVHCNHTDSLSIDLQIPAYQSYALVAQVTNPPPDALFWGNGDPYFYTRHLNSQEQQRIIVGGCDHRTGMGHPQDAINDLEAYVRSHFNTKQIETKWSAEYFNPTDGLPLIGLVSGKENVWIASGFGGVGLSVGTTAGRLIADQIAGEPVSIIESFSPCRFSILNIGKVISEQTAALPDLAERILPAKSLDLDSLQPGQGAVGNVAGVHTAVCRDRDGILHQRSPICTHMGGVVRWNEFEQTWDCPIHGGRFTHCGKRLYGPPQDGLPNIDTAN